MGRRSIALGAVVAAGVVATAVAGTSGFEKTGLVEAQQSSTPGRAVSTNSNSYKPIPDANGPTAQDWEQGTTVTVSLVVTQGRGKLRVIDAFDGGSLYPVGVPIRRGAQSFEFMLTPDDPSAFPPVVQWKKVGDQRLKASAAVVSIVGNID
jgi:hypothetical protein